MQRMNRISALPILAAMALCAFGSANAQGTWTSIPYGSMGALFDVKAMPNGDAWVARSGSDATRRGPAVYSADSAAWNYNPNGWNDFDSTFRDGNPGRPVIAVNSDGKIVLGSQASGMQSIAFYNGTAWSELTGNLSYRTSAYRGTSEIWAAPTGEFLSCTLWANGHVSRTGTATAPFGTVESIKGNLPNTAYLALSATGLGNVFVATGSGLFRSTNAGGAVGDVYWTRLSTTAFNALHVASDTFAVMGGSNGLIAYWDGNSVQTLTTPFENQVNDVFGFNANNIWAVGDGGLAQYWNGTAWSALDLPGIQSDYNLNAIDVNANGAGYIVGNSSRSSNNGWVWRKSRD